jgi:hypothetical protein
MWRMLVRLLPKRMPRISLRARLFVISRLSILMSGTLRSRRRWCAISLLLLSFWRIIRLGRRNVGPLRRTCDPSIIHNYV